MDVSAEVRQKKSMTYMTLSDETLPERLAGPFVVEVLSNPVSSTQHRNVGRKVNLPNQRTKFIFVLVTGIGVRSRISRGRSFARGRFAVNENVSGKAKTVTTQNRRRTQGQEHPRHLLRRSWEERGDV